MSNTDPDSDTIIALARVLAAADGCESRTLTHAERDTYLAAARATVARRLLASLPHTADCGACGHPASEHEAGECWVDLDTREGSQNPKRQCQCDWYRPVPAGR